MGNGIISVCCKKDKNEEKEILSNKKQNINNHYIYENFVNEKSGEITNKNNFINTIQKIGNILSCDFLFLIPNKIKKYIKDNPYENLTINTKNSSDDMNFENVNFSKPIQLKNNDIIYIGEWTKEGIINGKGKMYKPETKVYIEGEWSKGSLKYGRIITNNYIYIGYIQDNQYHGKGKLIELNGNIYEGSFLSGFKNGEGKYIYLDGCSYEGFYKNNEMNGYGIFKWKNGISYKGEFVNGIFNGNGILKWENNNIYNGQFKQGFLNGKGIYYWKNENEYYQGEYINNIKNGNGLYLFNNGDIYKGQWVNGKPSGKGSFETKNKIYSGQWKDGDFIEIIDIISKYQSVEIDENIDFNLKINKEIIDISSLEHINSKNMIEIN